MTKLRMQEAMVQVLVIGQDQQPFTVIIEPSNGIYISGNVKQIFKATLPFRGRKLRKYLEGLIYDGIVTQSLQAAGESAGHPVK